MGRGRGATPLQGVLWLLAFISLVFSLWAVSVGFGHTLFDFHGFRQAQTAISAETILHGGGLIKYETPILGPPWSLPFEFPLYQIAVAGAVHLFSTPLDQTGRFISILLYYLCFFPLTRILVRLGLRGTRMIPPLALFAVSPLYVFVSRLFMIESTALLLSLLYTEQVFRLVLAEVRWRFRPLAFAAVFGVLAGLVKVTTFAPFFVLGSLLIAWALWQDFQRGQLRLGISTGAILSCVLLPVSATWGWTKFADSVKSQNPLGVFLTSKALRAWNFGTLAQRSHPRIYLQLFYGADNHIGSVWAAIAVLAVYWWLCRRWNWIAAACVVLYIGTMLLFINLHLVHEYYSYANAIFLLVAAGVLIASMLELPGRAAWAGVALLVLVMGACVHRYLIHFYPLQSRNAPGRAQVAAAIDQMTDPKDVILIEGLDWSAELPYQSHRRAIMDPAFDSRSHVWSAGPIEAAIANAHPQNVTAVVACAKGREQPYLPTLLRDTDLNQAVALHVQDCDIYPRRAPGVASATKR